MDSERSSTGVGAATGEPVAAPSPGGSAILCRQAGVGSLSRWTVASPPRTWSRAGKPAMAPSPLGRRPSPGKPGSGLFPAGREPAVQRTGASHPWIQSRRPANRTRARHPDRASFPRSGAVLRRTGGELVVLVVVELCHPRWIPHRPPASRVRMGHPKTRVFRSEDQKAASARVPAYRPKGLDAVPPSRARRPRPQGFTSCESSHLPAGVLHPTGRPKPS